MGCNYFSMSWTQLTHCGLEISWHGSGSTLVQVMAWCLTAPSHYLNQCWFIISKVQWQPSITYLKFNSGPPGFIEFIFVRDTRWCTTGNHYNLELVGSYWNKSLSNWGWQGICLWASWLKSWDNFWGGIKLSGHNSACPNNAVVGTCKIGTWSGDYIWSKSTSVFSKFWFWAYRIFVKWLPGARRCTFYQHKLTLYVLNFSWET